MGDQRTAEPRPEAIGDDQHNHAGRPSWLPNGCPSWCISDTLKLGDGMKHHEGDRYADRIHFGQARTITLTVQDPGPEVPHPNGKEGIKNTYPQEAMLSLEQHFRESEARVSLTVADRPAAELTIAEAQQLADALYELTEAAQADVR